MVLLRPFTMDDVAAVTEACQDPEISRWTASIPWPYAEEDAESWITSQPAARAEGQALSMAITVQRFQRFAGSVSLNSFDWDFRTAQAGYWVAKPERGKGVATAALRTLTGWAFECLNLSLITLVTLVGNTASERVAENAHFDMVGRDDSLSTPALARDHAPCEGVESSGLNLVAVGALAAQSRRYGIPLASRVCVPIHGSSPAPCGAS